MDKYQANRQRASRVVVLLAPADLDRLDRYGVSAGHPSRSEAVRALVRKGASEHVATIAAEQITNAGASA